MPIFEFICRKCDHRFESIVLGGQQPQCPQCESKKLDQQISRFAVGGEKPAAASTSVGPCGTCGDPRGPGSCSMN